MKKIIILAIFLALPLVSKAQSIFDKYDGQDNVSSVVVNKKMFELMSRVKMEDSDKESQKYMALIKKLDNLKVFKTTNSRTTDDMRTNVEKHIAIANLEELMRVNENGKNSKIYVKSINGSTNISELLMFIEGSGNKNNETILLSLSGNFDLNEISLLTKKMNLPGSEVLDKVAKK